MGSGQNFPKISKQKYYPRGTHIMLKTTPLCGGSFGGYLLPHKGFQDAGTFSRLVGTTPLLRGTLTPLNVTVNSLFR